MGDHFPFCLRYFFYVIVESGDGDSSVFILSLIHILERIKDLPFIVTNVGKKDGKEYAPRLFDLTSLQVECNKKFAYSADETLKLIQSLYEKKVATYPLSLIHI